jgi:hypothetical protein
MDLFDGIGESSKPSIGCSRMVPGQYFVFVISLRE